MQEDSVIPPEAPYNGLMSAGRPAKFKRSGFGERLFHAREHAGLSQSQIAKSLAITQPTYAGWERRTTALKPEYISCLADLLNVSVDHLLGRKDTAQRKGGPTGKVRKVFEEVNKLPRNQQQRIVSVVEDMITARRSA